jgi:hypothetical protein
VYHKKNLIHKTHSDVQRSVTEFLFSVIKLQELAPVLPGVKLYPAACDDDLLIA